MPVRSREVLMAAKNPSRKKSATKRTGAKKPGGRTSRGKKYKYRGHEIVVAARRGTESVAIDGMKVEVLYQPELSSYLSLAMPHQTFDSLESLAQAVVDYLPDFEE
jgi:hypothetical protein